MQRNERPALKNLEILESSDKMVRENNGEIVPVALMKEHEGPSYHRLEAWIESMGQECPAAILQVICKYFFFCMDTFPQDYPPRES